MRDGQLVIPSRGALVQHVLQRYPIDPNNQAKAAAQQIVVSNLEALQRWLYA